MSSKKKTVADLTESAPIKLGNDSHSLHTNQLIYGFAHDVLHWLLNSASAYEIFREDLYEALIAEGMEQEQLPDNSTIRQNLELSHAGIGRMSEIVEQMNPGDLP